MINTKYFKYCCLALLVLVVLFGLTKHKPLNKQSNNQQANIIHYSATGLESFFDDAYAEAKPQEPENSAVGLLINHHLLGARLIAESFAKIATDRPVTVVLISPNHFNTGSGALTTSEAFWQTPYGTVEPDLGTIDNLVSAHIAQIDEDPFEQEHGISGIVSFIKRSLPNAKIVPLIIKDSVTVTQALELASSIRLALPTNTLIAGSFDFSHYLTHRAADFHDLSSLHVLQNFEYEKIPRLDIDSRPGLAMFLKLLELDQAQDFHLQTKSNAAALAKTDTILETTSYITGYFTKGQPNSPSPIHTLIALGMIDASSKTMSSLDRHNASFSIKFLERLFFGQDTTTAFIEPNKNLEQKLSQLRVNLAVKDSKLLDLESLKVFYINPKAPEEALALANAAIDNGADIAIVNGPLGSIHEYKHKLVFSGLGELLTKHSLSSTRPQYSLALGIGWKTTQLAIYLLPIKVEKGIAQLLTSPADDIVLKDLYNKSKVSPDIKKQILSGVININLNDYGTK